MRVEREYRIRVRPDPPFEEDWVILSATSTDFQPNRFAPAEWNPKAGQRVRFGGFFTRWANQTERMADAASYKRAFLKAVPDYVDGVIIDSQRFNRKIAPEVFWIQVPKGDYRGFSGGPAAIIDDSGEPLIVGVTVAFGELEYAKTGEDIYGMIITRVPPPR